MVIKDTIHSNGFSMDFFKFGHGNKTLVMLPGLSLKKIQPDAEKVAEAYSIMEDEFTVYLFDRRNELPPVYSIYDMAKDTATVIKGLGLKDIYLCGVSQGGMIAMSIAIENPRLVKKLALGSTSSHVDAKQLAAINEWISLAQKGEKEALCLSFAEKIYPPNVYDQCKDYFINLSKTITDEDIKRFIILASGTKGFHVTEILKVINCPVLAIGVFEDPVLDSDATMEMAEQFDWNCDFNLFMYTGFGHAAFDTAPDYKQRLFDFFTKE